MKIDWTISIGNVLTLAGLVGAGLWFVVSLRAHDEVLEVEMKMIGDRINIISHRLDQHINRSP